MYQTGLCRIFDWRPLAGTGNQQYRELPGSFLEPAFESAGEIHGMAPIVYIA
jgi:hypothetical protein